MNAMEGAALRDERSIERDCALAWQIEAMAREKSLKGLKHYLKKLKPRKPQTTDDILAVFREHQARGAKMDIRLIRPGEE